MKKILLTACAAVLAVNTAVAADEAHLWYLTPKVGGTFTDHDRNLVDNDLHYGLAIGKEINDRWNLEVNGLMSSHEISNTNFDLELSSLSLDVLRVFNRNGRFAPYITGGVGVIKDKLSPGPSQNDFMAQAGLGAFITAWKSSDGSHAFRIQPEAKYRSDDVGGAGHMDDVLVSIGLQFAFGSANTPAPMPVAARPAPAPVAAAPTPPPPPPRPSPAELDTDGDGVKDNVDRCPDTPRGTAVDTTGCTRRGSITLSGVQFETNSAVLKSESASVLDSVAADLKPHPRLKVEVQGHTDSVGADAYNLKLSQSRADSVRTYLVGKGVSADQIVAKGYGESKPIAENTSAEGRAQNRRVVMEVLDNPGDVQVKQSGAN
jgi:OmpA-OmpF porin, OOP family